MCPCNPTRQHVCGSCTDRIKTAAQVLAEHEAAHEFEAANRVRAALLTYGWKVQAVLGTEATA